MGCVRALGSAEGRTPTSSQLEVLRYSQPSEPRMWGFLRFALRCCCCCCCLPACLLCQLPYRGRCLPMKYLMQFRFTPFFFKKNFGGRLFFNAPSGHRTPIANSGGISLIPYTTEAQQLTVLSKYNNIAHNNCNLFAHNCWDLWIHQLALKGARGVAPGQPGFKNIHLGFHIFLPKVRPGTCSRAAQVLK